MKIQVEISITVKEKLKNRPENIKKIKDIFERYKAGDKKIEIINIGAGFLVIRDEKNNEIIIEEYSKMYVKLFYINDFKFEGE